MNETMQNDTGDGYLIELAAKGDSKAISEIVERHQAMVYGTCLRILGNKADAEDAAQATFILFLRKCGKLKRGTFLSGWLYRTARFVSREHIRKSARRKRREEKASIMQESNHVGTTQVWTELKPELDNALMALPKKHREVVILRYLEGKSTNDAARTLGMTPSAVSTCLARSIEKLRGHFQRRGIVIATVTLSAALAKHAATATAPVSLGPAIANAVASSTIATAGTATAALMVKGAITEMTWIKAKAIALVGVLITSSTLLGIYGAQLNPTQVDALDFTQEQTTKANAIIAGYMDSYLALEAKHVTMLVEEMDRVHFKVGSFSEELNELKENFWRDFDSICDERQRTVARRYLVLRHLFPLGKHPVEVKISYDDDLYHVSQKTTLPSGPPQTSKIGGTNLDPHWKRFWPGMEDTAPDVIKSVFGLVRGEVRADEKALTYEGERPVLTADFVETLNLDDGTAKRVNDILWNMRKQYLAEEKKQIAPLEVTEDPDGTKRVVVPRFRRERNTLEKKLWEELERVFDARQLRLARQVDDLKSPHHQLFDWGDATYSITIRKTAIAHDPKRQGHRYEIEVEMDSGWLGPNGYSSKTRRQLPEQYRRLLEK